MEFFSLPVFNLVNVYNFPWNIFNDILCGWLDVCSPILLLMAAFHDLYHRQLLQICIKYDSNSNKLRNTYTLIIKIEVNIQLSLYPLYTTIRNTCMQKALFWFMHKYTLVFYLKRWSSSYEVNNKLSHLHNIDQMHNNYIIKSPKCNGYLRGNPLTVYFPIYHFHVFKLWHHK